jgi:8-oxo-dGTP pyrophosphatase MutT (NUDIX family)
MNLTEVVGKKLKHQKQKKDRAGVYPLYYDDEGKAYVYMMVPSNPKFGGALPQMGKGGIDKGETPEQSAMREGYEELGLRSDNIKQIHFLTKDTVVGMEEYYEMYVFVAEVIDNDNFDPHGYEAKWTGWVELDEAIKVSRKNQQEFLRQVKAKFGSRALEEDTNATQEKIEEWERWANHLEEELADVQQEIKDKMSSGNPNPDGLYHRRNVLQAKVQHARAQIDLLNQNVEPLVGPGPEENDTSLSWGEWAKSLAPVIKRIKSECKPYLEATEYDVMEYRLYRGLKGTNAPYMSSRVRLTGRKPQATGTHIHDALNEWFTKKFGEPFRNALFTASKADFAADYGNLYLVFPTGNFSFIWSPKVGDLYDYDSQLDEALEEDKEHRYFDVTNGYF